MDSTCTAYNNFDPHEKLYLDTTANKAQEQAISWQFKTFFPLCPPHSKISSDYV